MTLPAVAPASAELTQAVEREALHQRDYLFEGFRRQDGLYDIEGRIADRKHYPFPNEWRGEVKVGEALHDMVARLTVDSDYRIVAIEVATKSSPFSLCPDIAPNFQSLVGAHLARGWSKILAEKVGGTQGCTHINELLRLMATVAFQTIAGDERRRNQGQSEVKGASPASSKARQGLIGSCHALAETSPVVAKHWPEFYRGEP